MTEKKFILLILVSFIFLGLTACGKPTAEPVQQPEEEDLHVYPDPFYDPDVIAAEVEALRSGEALPTQQQEEMDAEPTAAPEVAEVEPEPESALDSCVECHTDKEALIASAEPEIEAASENEGEG